MASIFYKVLSISILLLVGTNASKKALGRLQRSVHYLHYLLEDVVDIKQDILKLNDAVSALQNMSLLPSEDMCESSLDNDNILENETEYTVLTKMSGELDSKIAVIRKGFQNEKKLLRKQLQFYSKQMVDFERYLDSLDANFTCNLRDSEDNLRGEIQEVTSMVHDAKLILDNRTDHVEGKMEAMIETMVDTIANIVDKLDLNMDNMEKLSKRIGDVESEIHTIKQNELEDLSGKMTTLMEIFKFSKFKDYKRYGTSFYEISGHSRTWEIARLYCIRSSGYLVEIDDGDELNFIKTMVKRVLVWHGATDKHREGDWRWDMSGRPVDTDLWSRGEPNDSDGGEDCAELNGSTFNDVRCNLKRRFVCEYSAQHIFFTNMLKQL